MQTIYIDIANKSVLPTIYAKQGEVGRKFEVVLTDSGVPYNVESGVMFSVWYEGASGEGNYTDIGENSAFTISGNRVVVELITQMLVNPGCGTVCLVMNKGANQIGVWNIPYICEQVPGFDSEEAEGYYTAFSEAVKKISSPDPTLSVVGAPAEAKATGDALAERAFAERTVNGYPLTEDINLNAADIGAAPIGHVTDYSNPHNVTAEQVGARPSDWLPTTGEIGAAPYTGVVVQKNSSVKISTAGNFFVIGRLTGAAGTTGVYAVTAYSELRAPHVVSLADGAYITVSTGGNNDTGWYVEFANTNANGPVLLAVYGGFRIV